MHSVSPGPRVYPTAVGHWEPVLSTDPPSTAPPSRQTSPHYVRGWKFVSKLHRLGRTMPAVGGPAGLRGAAARVAPQVFLLFQSYHINLNKTNGSQDPSLLFNLMR